MKKCPKSNRSTDLHLQLDVPTKPKGPKVRAGSQIPWALSPDYFKCRSTGNYGFLSMGFLRSSLQNQFWTSLSLDKLTPLFLYIDVSLVSLQLWTSFFRLLMGALRYPTLEWKSHTSRHS